MVLQRNELPQVGLEPTAFVYCNVYSVVVVVYLSQCLPVEEVTQSLCSVSLNDPLSTSLTAELKHVL